MAIVGDNYQILIDTDDPDQCSGTLADCFIQYLVATSDMKYFVKGNILPFYTQGGEMREGMEVFLFIYIYFKPYKRQQY